MKHLACAAVVAFSLTLAGCNNQPEEAPDISDAIPLDEADEASSEEGDAPPDLPGEQDGEQGSNQGGQPGNAAPATRPGANPYGGENEGAPEPGPPGSKLLPADPDY